MRWWSRSAPELAGRADVVDTDHRVKLDPVRTGQQRRVLARQQVGAHDGLLGVEQGPLRVGDHHDDPRSVLAPEPVDAKTMAELADRGKDPFLAGEVVRGDLFWRTGAIEVRELGVHRESPVWLVMGCTSESAVGPAPPDQCQHVPSVRNLAVVDTCWHGGAD